MALRVEHLVDQDLRDAVRLVLDALAPLVLDDVALGVDGLGRHGIQQVAHAIRFEEERKLQRVGRHIDPVVGPVVLRRSVVVAAGGFEPRIELAGLDVSGSHEHQMFEEVREPGAAGALARGAHVVPHVHGDDWHFVVLVQDHREAVGQPEVRIRDVELRLRARGRRQRKNEQE